MVVYNFRTLKPVPSGPEMLDIVLSRTQRKTATQVHKRFAISRIRTFYMMKVKFTQQTFSERIGQIVDEFPRLDSIHPFYADLINVLYDRDHYKLALGQLNTARSLIDNIAKDYVRLLKFGDSLYRCKHLKRAALGRMATVVKKLKASLGYLEQVRQHLSRLPSIDPSTRTLMLTGYPNVGKSSFINKVTRADVDVQPYAFTTKSLFVGHMDYKYLRWQVIDTPGILDHPLEQRNTIEMQAVTALAHLNCAVLFLLDVSGQGEYPLSTQVSLFHSIRPLFANKPLLVVANKTDVRELDMLDEDDQAALKTITDLGVAIMPMSNVAETGVMDVKTTACDLLLQHRVSGKLKTNKVDAIRHRIHVARPVPRDNVERPVCIPASVKARQARMDLEKKTMKMVEEENGGAGVFNVDLRMHWQLENEEWTRDKIPEIFNGKNVADFFDADIEARLDALEREEAVLEQVAEGDEDDTSDLDEDTLALHEEVQEKKKLLALKARREHANNSSAMPRKHREPRRLADFEKHLNDLGLDGSAVRSRSRGRKRTRALSDASEAAMEVEEGAAARSMSKTARSKSRLPTPAPGTESAFANEKQKVKARKMAKKMQTKSNLMARAGEGDRAIRDKMPKHLFSGKRGIGKTDRR